MKIHKLKIENCKIENHTGGYAVLELLFYISILATLSLLVINSMINMTLSFKETSIYGQLVQNGNIMERMSREIRTAHDIGSFSATNLRLNTDDADVNKTVEFILSDGNLQFLKNDGFVGNLNTPNIVVTSLSFTQITTVKGKAVKIYLAVRASNDKLNRVFEFYDTVVLRGQY